jgi:hypothetical protein
MSEEPDVASIHRQREHAVELSLALYQAARALERLAATGQGELRHLAERYRAIAAKTEDVFQRRP